MNFHLPRRTARPPACSIRDSRPTGSSPSSAARWLRLSGAVATRSADAGQGREAREEVDLADQRLRGPGLDPARPADEERDAGAALELAVLAAAIRAGRPVVAELLDGVVAIAVVDDRAVVAGEDDQRVLGQPALVERLEHLADRPVELDDRVAPRAHPALAGEPRVRHARDVDVVGREVEEERPGLVPLDERDGLARERVGHVLVLPEGRLAALHVADPADAVDDRHVVAVAGMEPQQLGVGLARRLAVDRPAVADLDRVGRVEADDAMAPHVDARDAVAGRRHDEALVEPDLERPRLDLAVPVDRARPRAPGATCRRPRSGSRPPSARSASVVRPGSMISLASPGRTPVPCFRQGYSPVSRAYRDGVQVAEVAWASVKFSPCLASRSMFGVSPALAPLQPTSPKPEVVGVDQHDVRRGRGDVTAKGGEAEDQDDGA